MIFPLQRPRRIPEITKANIEARNDFIVNISAEIDFGDTDLYFCDEAFFLRETSITRGWYLKGSKPTIYIGSKYQKSGVCSSINYRTGELFSLLIPEFNSDSFELYLNELIKAKRKDKKITLIVDNAAPHRSDQIKKFIKKNKDDIEIIFLPPYSPDLNPQEMVWRDLRASKTHNKFFDTLINLEETLCKYLKKFSVPNEKLRILCNFF